MSRKDREARAGSQGASRNPDHNSDAAGEGASTRPRWGAAPSSETVRLRAFDLVATLLQRDDGWLRLIPSRDGSPVYAKWKFTSGRHANHYVMSVAQYWQVEYLFQLLLLKLDRVDAGDLSDLAKDTLYNHAADEKRHA